MGLFFTAPRRDACHGMVQPSGEVLSYVADGDLQDRCRDTYNRTVGLLPSNEPSLFNHTLAQSSKGGPDAQTAGNYRMANLC